MADKSGIEWTEASWNPIAGCGVLSPGCTNCYAMREAGGRLRSSAKFAGLTQPSKAGPVWTGEVRLWEPALDQPLRWAKPRRIFVNSMSDLFHESVPHEWIARIFAVMRDAPQHTYQILTKRAERQRDFMQWWVMQHVEQPPSNWWLGVSCEDQPRANLRIPQLLATWAAVRWISAEPLLGPVDVMRWLTQRNVYRGDTVSGFLDYTEALDWVVIGGESGPGARPMHPDWARSIRDQCQAAGVPFFFKQWGEWMFDERVGQKLMRADDQPHPIDERWSMIRVGKKAAGRELDGRTWDDCPLVSGTEEHR
jgi:protein gp37